MQHSRLSHAIIAISTLILIALAITASSGTTYGYQVAPVSEEQLIRLLVQRVPSRDIIRTIEERGVRFELMPAFEEEIREAAVQLTKKEVKDLLSAIRDNFRQPSTRPFRVSYRLLKGHAADLLLDGRIDKNWDEVLAGKNFVLRNDVFISLSRLMKMFSSRRFGEQAFYDEPSDDKEVYESEKLAKFYRTKRKPLFVGGAGEPADGAPAYAISVTDPVGLIPSLNDPTQQWRLIQVSPDIVTEPKKGAPAKTPRDIFTFRKFADRPDFREFFPARLARFYSYITRDYLPPDFAILELSLIREEEGPLCEEELGKLETSATLVGPLLSLNIAIIENVSNEPLSVGRFFFKENKLARLRTREQDRAVLNSATFQKQDLFSPGVLKAGEKLVIPLELLLEIENEDELFAQSAPESADDPLMFKSELARVRQSGGLRFPGVPAASRVTAESIERMLRRPKVDFSSTNEYLYGPSVSIETVEINSYGYLVRHFDPKKLLITGRGEEEGGSCPYVYTFSASEDSWLSEGVVLHGYATKLRESTEERLLRRFDGRVLIREKDQEDSFIDMVQIRATSGDGSQTLLNPKNMKLRAADGDYVQLKHGQQLMVDFEIPKGLAAQSYVMVASGYYMPYYSKPKKSNRRAVLINGMRRLRLAR